MLCYIVCSNSMKSTISHFDSLQQDLEVIIEIKIFFVIVLVTTILICGFENIVNAYLEINIIF